MSTRALLIGFEDCEYCQKANNFLEVCGFEVDWLKSSKNRKEKLPPEYANWKGDYIFHMKSYYILPKSLIDNAAIAAINFHPGSPKYPGSGCVNWALYNNEKTTGVTIHFLNEHIDNGDIINVFKIPIFPNDNIETLLPRVHMKQLGAFYDLVTTTQKYGSAILQRFVENNKNIKWGPKVGRIKGIDRLQMVDSKISEEELQKIIRATAIGKFGPRLKLHGHEFRYYKEKK
mgnify:FL=1